MSLSLITVERVSELKKEEWQFWLNREKPALVLQYYTEYARSTTRHKFKAIESYSRLDTRGNTLQDPPLPGTVVDDARRALMDILTVEK